MPRFLVTYHGGGEMPASAEAQAQIHAAFANWAAGVGAALADPGAPLGPPNVVSSGSVSAPEGRWVGGYSIIDADSMDAAVALVKPHPFLTRGGTLQVHEALNLAG